MKILVFLITSLIIAAPLPLESLERKVTPNEIQRAKSSLKELFSHYELNLKKETWSQEELDDLSAYYQELKRLEESFMPPLAIQRPDRLVIMINKLPLLKKIQFEKKVIEKIFKTTLSSESKNLVISTHIDPSLL